MSRVKIDDDLCYILAVGNENENGILAHPARKHGFSIFYGDSLNIPNRHLQAAKVYSLDAIISLDGDDLLVSAHALESVMDAILAGSKLVRTEGLPYGMNVLWAYTVSFLEECLKQPARGSFDTGWGWIFDGKNINCIIYDIKDAEQIRATLDYPEDLKFFRNVFEQCGREIINNDNLLCEFIVKNRIHKINKNRHIVT